MSITSRPATAIIIALAAFLIATLTLACSSAPAQRTAAPPAAPPAVRSPSLRRRSLTADNPRHRPAHTNRHRTAYAKSQRREYRPGRSGNALYNTHQWKQFDTGWTTLIG